MYRLYFQEAVARHVIDFCAGLGGVVSKSLGGRKRGSFKNLKPRVGPGSPMSQLLSSRPHILG